MTELLLGLDLFRMRELILHLFVVIAVLDIECLILLYPEHHYLIALVQSDVRQLDIEVLS